MEIEHLVSGGVIFSHECANNTVKITVEAAVKINTYLAGANLEGAA